MSDWDWWQRKLAGEPVEMNPDSPHAGFYRPWSRTTFGARLAGFCAVLIRVRNWQIVLQKSAVIAARLLPRSLGTVLTIRSLRSGDAGSNGTIHDMG